MNMGGARRLLRAAAAGWWSHLDSDEMGSGGLARTLDRLFSTVLFQCLPTGMRCLHSTHLNPDGQWWDESGSVFPRLNILQPCWRMFGQTDICWRFSRRWLRIKKKKKTGGYWETLSNLLEPSGQSVDFNPVDLSLWHCQLSDLYLDLLRHLWYKTNKAKIWICCRQSISPFLWVVRDWGMLLSHV